MTSNSPWRSGLVWRKATPGTTPKAWRPSTWRTSVSNVDKLRAAPACLTGGWEYGKHEKGLLRPDGQPGFATPSGKVELYSARLQGLGYDPLPAYQEPAESPVSAPEVAARYPLVGVNRRPLAYVHYKYRNLPSLRKLEPEPCVYLSAEDARDRGLAGGEWVAVRSPRGQIRMRARIRERAKPGVAWIDGGWGNPWDHEDANINDLTDSEQLDPMVQCPSISSFCVRWSEVAARHARRRPRRARSAGP